MAKVLPFKGVLYNRKKIEHLEAVMAPPYDVISQEMRDELSGAHFYNVVRIILGSDSKADNKKNNKYTRAAGLLSKWLKESVLEKDKKPAVYIYEQKYFCKGKVMKRTGFISLMKIEDPSSSLVLPHEYTFSKPKEDRLNLIRSTKANTSPIFCVFEDSGNKVIVAIREYARKTRPIIDIHLHGVHHKLWRMSDSKLINRIKEGLDKKQVFIADGHHRYEVALNFRNEMRKRLGKNKAKKFDNVMVYFSSLADKGLTVFSTYRVIKNLGKIKWSRLEKKLKPYFNIENVKNKEDMFKKLKKAKSEYVFGVYFKNRHFYLLTLKNESVLAGAIKVDQLRKWGKLNVTVLHLLIFNHILHMDKFSKTGKNIIYTRDENYAIDLVNKGECDIAFFQLPAKVAQVRNIARSGNRMPHKSTYFYPKLLTGLVINKF